jgi:ATP-dependent Clp protease ATP-binding subunit ClpB
MDLANLKEDRNEIYAKWKKKDVVDNIQAIKTEIEDFMKQNVQSEGDYGKVAEIRYGKIKEAQERLDILNKELIENQAEGTSLIKEEVTREDIEVVAKWTGIPIMKMLQENEKNCCIWKKNYIDA